MAVAKCACHPVLACACPACVLQGLEAILRVRCSSGLDVDGYVGSFYKPPNSPTDLYLPAVDCDKALVARLEIVEKLPANSEVDNEKPAAQSCCIDVDVVRTYMCTCERTALVGHCADMRSCCWPACCRCTCNVRCCTPRLMVPGACV